MRSRMSAGALNLTYHARSSDWLSENEKTFCANARRFRSNPGDRIRGQYAEGAIVISNANIRQRSVVLSLTLLASGISR